MKRPFRIAFCLALAVIAVPIALSHRRAQQEQMNHALIDAAQRRDTATLFALLDAGADPNSRTLLGGTALEIAEATGNAEAVRMLVQRGAPIDAPDSTSRTALFRAAARGNLEVVQSLLDQGAQVNACDKHGRTPLLVASQGGFPGVVKALLAAGADLRASDKRSRTALHLAAAERAPRTMEVLLRQGANPNATDGRGWTVLPFAIVMAEQVPVSAESFLNSGGAPAGFSTPTVHREHPVSLSVVARLLLRHGARIDPTEIKAGSLLDQSVGRIEGDVVDAVRSLGARSSPDGSLLMGASLARSKEIRAALANGAHVEATDRDGRTALGWAVERKSVIAARILLDRGASSCHTTTRNLTVFERAVELGDLPMVRLLVERGASLNSSHPGFPTPLLRAVSAGRTDVVRFLLAREAGVKNRVTDEDRLLAAAAGTGRTEIVRLLLERGAGANEGSPWGGAALSAACIGLHPDTVRLLLEAGADPDYRNRQGRDLASAVGLRRPQRSTAASASNDPISIRADAILQLLDEFRRKRETSVSVRP